MRFYSLALSEDHLPKLSVFIKYSWVWGVVFRSYVLVVPGMSWRMLSSLAITLASTLRPSHYYFTQYHFFQRCFPQNRSIGWFLRFSYPVFLRFCAR